MLRTFLGKPEIFEIPMFCVNRASTVLTEIQPVKNVKIYKEMYGHPGAVRTQQSGQLSRTAVRDTASQWLYLSQN